MFDLSALLIDTGVVTSVNEDAPVANQRLGQPYPLPARQGGEVSLPYWGPAPQNVEVFDLLGRQVDVEVETQADRIRLGSFPAPGTYLVRAQFGGRSPETRVVVVR